MNLQTVWSTAGFVFMQRHQSQTFGSGAKIPKYQNLTHHYVCKHRIGY
uniref:Uncharacterized protein n=1 Tax=Anguilla anguilla TaxID=7936 RepID=A0A0E9P9K1_ANGAN